MEFGRNGERYEFLKWGAKSFQNFRVVPPATGIVHQVNLEYLAQGVMTAKGAAGSVAFPDTLVGTDSHTTMINGLGVLGWGVGGIEAEAAMLGQPLYMLTPQVVGFSLTGQAARRRDRHRPRPHRHPDAAQEGRGREVRGVLRPRPRPDEPGRPRHHREHGARIRRDLRLLPGGRRDAPLPAAHRAHRDQAALVERYCKEQGLFRTDERHGSGLLGYPRPGPGHASSRASPVPSAPRTASPSPR